MFEVGQEVVLMTDIEIVGYDGDAYDWIDEGEMGKITEFGSDGIWVRFPHGEVLVKEEWLKGLE